MAVGFAPFALAAEAEDFRTPEYLNSTGLERINAAEAYALGFTGQGVVVGVVDSLFAPQTGEFAGKYPYGVFNYKEGDDHGIHVSGIIAARRDGVGMHGAAFDAALLPVSWYYPFNFPDRIAFFEDIASRSMFGVGSLSWYANWEEMLAYPDIRIVNNSWGTLFYQDQIDDTLMNDPGWHYITGLAQRLAEADILQVFSAHNQGHVGPTMTAGMPSVLLDYGDPGQKNLGRALSLRWLNVAAFDPDQPASSPGFVAPFTNMGWNASAYTLWAPGMFINSTIAPSEYALDSGTSMAAPYVSGTAALVQSAFPYMGGKQLADVLLSTATPFTTPGKDVPPVFLLLRIEYGEKGYRLVMYSTQGHVISDAEKEAMIEALIKRFNDCGRACAEDWVNEAISGHYVRELPPDEYLALFGAGIVNAGKAVRGPGYFDARRLDNADKATYGGVDYAMYAVNTKGYNSVWSNNIGEKPVAAGITSADPHYLYIHELAGLSVGLLKQGDGLLALSGQNTYLGPTVVKGGEISLGVTGQIDSTARLKGAVIVEPAGTFSGNGLIGGNLQFSGLLAPGLASTPGSRLTVTGNITGGGTLFSRLWTDGSSNPLIGHADLSLNNTTVRLSDLTGSRALPQQNYLLAQGNNLTGTTANDFAVARQGVTLLHDFNLHIQDNALYALYDHSRAAPEAKALSEGFLAGSALLHQGADIIAGQGMEAAVVSARHAARSGPASGSGPGAAFGVLTGGNVRYHTGSHVNMRSASLLTGLAVEIEQRESDLTLAAFFEYGNGSYDTYNSFANAGRFKGDGDTHHFGGGILGRMDFVDSGSGHFYTEGSARLGKVHNDYGNADLRDASGRKATYDSSSVYYGAHLGMGHVWNIDQAARLDLHGKYFWTRQEGDSVTLSTGDPVHFKPVDSQRLRFGSRFGYAINERVSPYIGAAWEREFDGKARAAANGYAMDAPSLRGNTGIGELGLTLAPSASLPLSFDLSLQGYVGKREGASGSLQIKYKF